MNPIPALAFALLAALAIDPVRADPPAADSCAQNPATCENAAARVRERCTADPARCEQIRERLQSLKAKCDADPQACEEKKAQWRQRAQELKAKCDADPEACERRKQEFRKRLQDQRRQHVAPAGETPPILSPTPEK